MGRGDVQKSDQELNEFLRQEKLPGELQEKYPNISGLVGAANIGQPDVKVMSALGRAAMGREPASLEDRPDSSFDFLRRGEDLATNAYAKDIAHTTNPDEFSDFLQAKDKTNYPVYANSQAIQDLAPKNGPRIEGAYVPNEDYAAVDPTLKNTRLLGTLLHEHGHARDAVRSENPATINARAEAGREQTSVPEPFNQIIRNQDDIGLAANQITGKHFNEPGSHNINEFLRAVKEIGQQQGVVPNYEQRYSKIKALLGK